MNSSKMNVSPWPLRGKGWLALFATVGMTILEGGKGSVGVVRVDKALAGMEDSRLFIELQITPVASYPILLVNKMY